jgi:FAD/FMN-containing dehydrogenase
LRHPADPSDYGFRGRFARDEGERIAFSTAAGIVSALPTAVAVPADAADVAALVAWAHRHRVPLHPRGAGTGMPGGNVGPGIAVDLVTGFRQPPKLDPAALRARVRPGTTPAELDARAAAFGLHFPVDPSSGRHCTLGGMIANNAAGAHSVHFGATREWVETLRVVLADGSLVTLRRGDPPPVTLRPVLEQLDAVLAPHREAIAAHWPRVRKNSSGYALREYLNSGDAVDLVVGSEGTLALVVAAELRLAPRSPCKGLALLEFPDLAGAGAAILDILPLRPATCEILDRTFLDLVRQGGESGHPALRPGLEAVLLVEVAGDTRAAIEARLTEIAAAAGTATGVHIAFDPARVHALWEIRHAASPIIARTAGRRISMQFIEDSVVPVVRLPEYIASLRAILLRHELPAVIFGHAGDGNLHVNPLVDVSLPGWPDRLEKVLDDVATLVVSLGGTLAGEHGDGRIRAPYLAQVWGEPIFSCFRAVKRLFDPHAILNPGVILPLPGQRPFDRVRNFV